VRNPPFLSLPQVKDDRFVEPMKEKLSPSSTKLITSGTKDGRPDRFHIFVKNLTRKTKLLWVSEGDSTVDLKSLLEQRMGIPSSFQCLIYQGKQLQDSSMLTEYKIK